MDWYRGGCITVFSVPLLIISTIWFTFLHIGERWVDVFREIFIRTQRSLLWVQNQLIVHHCICNFFPMCTTFHLTMSHFICRFLIQALSLVKSFYSSSVLHSHFNFITICPLTFLYLNSLISLAICDTSLLALFFQIIYEYIKQHKSQHRSLQTPLVIFLFYENQPLFLF